MSSQTRAALLSSELLSMLKLNFNGPASHFTGVRFPYTLKSQGAFELKVRLPNQRTENIIEHSL